MENFRLLTESISSYVFTFVTKLNWMNKTLLKLRVAQRDSASPRNRKVPDSNPIDAVGVDFRIQPRYKTPADPRVSWPWSSQMSHKTLEQNWKKSYLYIINIIRWNVIFSECYVSENKQIRVSSNWSRVFFRRFNKVFRAFLE